MKFSDKLNDMQACSEAVKWVGRKGLKTSWNACNRADWMLWYAARILDDKKLIVLAACDCAETALKYAPKGEKRPAKAIATARKWCNGKATIKQVHAAAYAAADAAAAAAAYAAAYAAYADADAADAAAAAYADAARKQSLAEQADLVKARIPIELLL